MKLAELAERTGAAVERGDGDLEIAGAAGLDLAGANEITFLANPKYTPQVRETRAGAIYLSEGVEIERGDLAVLRAPDAYVAYTLALREFHPPRKAAPGIHPTAVVEDSAEVDGRAEIGAHVYVGPGCRIERDVRILPNATLYENVRVGRGTVIHSNVSVRENTVIGRDCVIHNNATIGCDGFGYARTADKRWLKIPQTGRVVLGDEVEIGANTAIDRASVGETRIERGAKLDNLVQIGHSCTVGEDALICAQTGLAGSSVIGRRVILAGQVGIAGHLKVGDDVVMTAKSATSHDVPEGRVMSGIPAFDNRDWLRSTAAFRRLGEMARKLRELEKRIGGSAD